MATISSPGIGSGLDVKSIVSQLVALEKQPLAQLQKSAATLDAKISAYGQLKSQISNLNDQASKLADHRLGAMKLTSSNAAIWHSHQLGGGQRVQHGSQSTGATANHRQRLYHCEHSGGRGNYHHQPG